MSNLTRTPPGAGLAIKPNSVKRSREDDETTEKAISLDAAVKMLMDQFTETKGMIEELRIDLNSKINAVKSELEGKLDAVSQEIVDLRSECTKKCDATDISVNALNARVEQISTAVGNLENRNELIISGIPYMTGEDLRAYFRATCKQLGFGDSSVPFVDLRRMKSGNLKDGDDSLVVVQFALKNSRDNFYGAYLRKRNLQLSHIGLNSTRRIYVNENLTISARKVKAAALRAKKAGKVSSVFTRLGTVYVKSAADGPAIPVYSEEQLNDS